MTVVVIDILNPDNEEKKPKKTADTKEKDSYRTRCFLRKQVVTIDGQIIDG